MAETGVVIPLTEQTGLEHLKMHLLSLITLMGAAYNWEHFEEMATRSFGKTLSPVQMKLLIVA